MSHPIVIQLTFPELWQGAQAGCYRRLTGIKCNMNKNKHASKSDWATDIDGAIAEIAFAKHMGFYWDASNCSFKQPDVGLWQVRSTRHSDGCLIIRPNDKNEEERFVLAISDETSVALIGWIQVKDAKKEIFWNADGWWVPQSILTPFFMF